MRLVLADCEAAGDGLDEGFFKVEVTATHVARAVDQERNVSGNRDMGHACTLENDILVVRYSPVKFVCTGRLNSIMCYCLKLTYPYFGKIFKI